MSRRLIISCEHAGNDVPEEYRHLFKHGRDTLQTHRGIDIGALDLTNAIAKKMEQEAHLHTVTRLLVDLNRSVQSPTLFSEFTRDEPLEVREDIFDRYYRPHREKVKAEIKKVIDQDYQAIHVGVHTFTPIWKNKEREVDVGFLFDPRSDQEQQFCWRWRKELNHLLPDLTLRMNEPYRGTMDGFTTYLRRQFPQNDYLGMEIEVNQKFTRDEYSDTWKKIKTHIPEALDKAFDHFS